MWAEASCAQTNAITARNKNLCILFMGSLRGHHITAPGSVEGNDCKRHSHLPSESGIPDPSGSVRMLRPHWAGPPVQRGRVQNRNHDFDSEKGKCSSARQAYRGTEEARPAVPEIRNGKGARV